MIQFGATILGCEGVKLGREEKALFADTQPFGFILFARNIENPLQVKGLCEELREAAGHDAPILIDQEGGRVQRLRAPYWREWLPPLDHAARAGTEARHAMYLRYRLIAHELREIGIDANCAPMVDVAEPETHEFLLNRCYGFDPGTVADLGRAVSDGLMDGGVLPVLKHIPGHGRARADSHLELPHVHASEDALISQDFAPFHALRDLPMGMTAHIVYDALDSAPATTSPKLMRMIREEIGFGGLIMTDDISMQALSGSLAQRSNSSLRAGCDVILHCNGDLSEMREVTETAGEMTSQAQVRAETALAARRPPVPINPEALWDELNALIEA